jgi:hypothetical protein
MFESSVSKQSNSESVSDIDQSRFELALEYSDAPFVPVFPAVFTDAPS